MLCENEQIKRLEKRFFFMVLNVAALNRLDGWYGYKYGKLSSQIKLLLKQTLPLLFLFFIHNNQYSFYFLQNTIFYFS